MWVVGKGGVDGCVNPPRRLNWRVAETCPMWRRRKTGGNTVPAKDSGRSREGEMLKKVRGKVSIEIARVGSWGKVEKGRR